MTHEEMEKIYQDARNTSPEEMRELTDLMQYVHGRTEELDGKDGARGLMIATTAAQYGKVKSPGTSPGHCEKAEEVAVCHFSDFLLMATLKKLAKRLNHKTVNRKVMIYADEFFEPFFDGAIASSVPYMEADIQPRPDNDETAQKWNEGFMRGFDRGFFEGLAAMEKFLLFCDEVED